MRYVSPNLESVRVQGSFKSQLNKSYDPEYLRSEFENINCFEPYRISNRSIWPNKKLVGVEFDPIDSKFKGEIRSDTIKLTVKDIDSFEKSYDKLQEWFDQTDIMLPEQDEFLCTTYAFLVDNDDYKLTTDDTKCAERDEIMGCIHRNDGIKGTYSSMNGFVSVSLENNEGVPIKKARQHLKSLLDAEIVIYGSASEIKNNTEEREKYENPYVVSN